MPVVNNSLVNDSSSHRDDKLSTDAEANFPEEREGWEGYIEWERYPKRKQKAHEILKANKHRFEGVSQT